MERANKKKLRRPHARRTMHDRANYAMNVAEQAIESIVRKALQGSWHKVYKVQARPMVKLLSDPQLTAAGAKLKAGCWMAAVG